MLCVFVLLLVLSLTALLKPFYYRFYPGDRITGTVRITQDNSVLPINESSVQLKSEGSVTANNDGSAYISLRAGDYGDYGFEIPEINGRRLSFTCFQHNYWNVLSFDIDVSVNTAENTVDFIGAYTFVSDNGELVSSEITNGQKLDENEISLLIGI